VPRQIQDVCTCLNAQQFFFLQIFLRHVSILNPVSLADQGEAARQKEWELADEDERADILMGSQLEELFW